MSKTNDAVEITKLTMKIGDKKLELTVAEAQKLHAALKELFDKVQVITYTNYPTIIWKQDNIWDRNPYKPWPWSQPIVSYCGTGTKAKTFELTWEAK